MVFHKKNCIIIVPVNDFFAELCELMSRGEEFLVQLVILFPKGNYFGTKFFHSFLKAGCDAFSFFFPPEMMLMSFIYFLPVSHYNLIIRRTCCSASDAFPRAESGLWSFCHISLVTISFYQLVQSYSDTRCRLPWTKKEYRININIQRVAII